MCNKDADSDEKNIELQKEIESLKEHIQSLEKQIQQIQTIIKEKLENLKNNTQRDFANFLRTIVSPETGESIIVVFKRIIAESTIFNQQIKTETEKMLTELNFLFPKKKD